MVERLVSIFRKCLITGGVHNILFSRLHLLTLEDCFSPLCSWGKHGKGQPLDIYLCAAMVRGEQLCPWRVQVMRAMYSNPVTSAADSAAAEGDSARRAPSLASVKHSVYPSNRPPRSQSKSEPACKPRSPTSCNPNCC